MGEKLHDHSKGKGLPKGWVASTTLFAEVGSEFVGRLGIRHEMMLWEYGTMIGYMVAPPYRRRGYATAMLAAALPLAREITGKTEIIIDCHESNVGSRRVIEKNGGKLVRRGQARGVPMLYFSISPPDAE